MKIRSLLRSSRRGLQITLASLLLSSQLFLVSTAATGQGSQTGDLQGQTSDAQTSDPTAQLQATALDAKWPQGPQINGASALLMDVNSGTVLYAKEDLTTRYPTSITKLMTVLVAVEHSKMEETVTFSRDA